jgi:hypothetical protein
MKVLYSEYSLTPLRKANRLSSLDSKRGVFLKGTLGDKVLFADYFPHEALGDSSIGEFLSRFKYQDHEYDKKVFHFLLKDHDYQKLKPVKFFNHELWIGTGASHSSVAKYKLQGHDDFSFLPLLENKVRLRLDANGLFSRKEFSDFVKQIPELSRHLIEYIEDPLKDTDWSDLALPSARDFIAGSPYEVFIYKPNCEMRQKNDKKTIYSSYMGSDLGRWHSFCDLVETGDLKEYHGIVTKGLYQEQIDFFKGSFNEGFVPELELVKKVYKEVSHSEWKVLCSM